MQERMLKNIAFFNQNKIAESLKIASKGQNRKFALFFNQSEINIIDLKQRRFLYPQNAFLQIAQNIASNPLNNDKWSIYANNLTLSKLSEKPPLNATRNAINKIIDLNQTHQNQAENISEVDSNKMDSIHDEADFSKVDSSVEDSSGATYKNADSSNADFNKADSSDKLDSSIWAKNEAKANANIADSSYHLPPCFLPQTNIFGLCGGLFLDILLENGYFFHSLLIYEEEAELFALSCYFVDYERLFSRTSAKSCYIFIENLLDKAFLNHYFYSKKITNNFLRLELSLVNSPKTQTFRAMTSEAYKANARGWGSFEDEIIGIKNTLQNAESSPFIQLNQKLQIPICVVGSGPSLELNIDFIRQNQHKMLVFSCGTALKVLKNHNIHIDFQVEIERVPYLDSVLKSSNLGDTTLLCASLIDSNALRLAKNAMLFMRGGSAAGYALPNVAAVEFCAPFVGNAGFALAAQLSDEIILCGMDCGYIKGFAKHSKGSFYGDESEEIPPNCFKVAGNADFEVYSNAIFSLSKESFALAIKHYKPKIVHNLSFGAKITGARFSRNLTLKSIANKAKILESIESFRVDSAILRENRARFCDLQFIKELKKRLDCEVSSKEELFYFIDLMSEFLAKSAFENPAIGILFEGSISHLLQNTLIALLKIKKNAIGVEFKAYKSIILEAVADFEREIIDEFSDKSEGVK